MSVVMLSGPVAAGKTTVARELVAISPALLCYIEGDEFWKAFAKPDSRPLVASIAMVRGCGSLLTHASSSRRVAPTLPS